MIIKGKNLAAVQTALGVSGGHLGTPYALKFLSPHHPCKPLKYIRKKNVGLRCRDVRRCSDFVRAGADTLEQLSN